MKLERISVSELATADLNEREMCRLLGGGEPGCCQCGCHYTSTTATNDAANNEYGYTSDPGAQPCNCPEEPDPEPIHECDFFCKPIVKPTQTTWTLDCGVHPVDNCKP